MNHEEFFASCTLGRGAADERVEQRFYERAVGYTYDGEKLFMHEGKIIREAVKVHVPPDARAGEFWLRNRRPDRWKDAKQLETRTADDDPLVAYLKCIDGRVLRPIEQNESAIEAEYVELKEQSDEDAPPPRLFGKPQQ
jgi:hypothetical protein